MSSIKGKVKWFSKQKGYGFIVPDDGRKDIFVHYTGIVHNEDGGQRNLEENDKVIFEVVDGPKGPQAQNVRTIGEN